MSPSVFLRPTTAADLPIIFQNQIDPDSNALARTKPHSAEKFQTIWQGVIQDPGIVSRVIVEGAQVVGVINCFKVNGQDSIGYWIGRPHWGRGLATKALSLMLKEVPRRPLHASAALSNTASIHILERCGFRLTGHHEGEETDRHFARKFATFVLDQAMPTLNIQAISLRPVTPQDLPTLFEQQLDPESNRMSGTKPHDQEKFQATWDRIFKDPNVVSRVIIEGAQIVGGISCFQKDGQDLVGYRIDRPHWGRGIATQALSLLIKEVPRRPLHASAARENAASIRVLERCGFRLTGYFMGEETDRYVAGEVATFVLE